MRIVLEIVCCIFLFLFFTFPLWLHGNWKTIFDKDLNKYLKKSKRNLKSLSVKYEYPNKICTQYQPFKISKKKYVICNFLCDGDCQFKGTRYYIQKIN